MMLPVSSQQIKNLIYRASAPLLKPMYSGLGSIFMFHRVLDSKLPDRAGWPHQHEISPSLLETLVLSLRRKGYSIISLDELITVLRGQIRERHKLAVLTFDDGYTDTYEVVYPLLKNLGTPFTLYLTTGFPDRTLVPWWNLLEDYLASKSQVDCMLDGRTVHLLTRTPEQRERAFSVISSFFENALPHSQQALAEELFGRDCVERKTAEVFISWDQVRTLAADPLVTLGAHTINHSTLRKLPSSELRREIFGSKQIIERRLDVPVRHFAYPYGAREHVGTREFAMCKEAGFDSAVTTRVANIFVQHVRHLECLPRVYGKTLEEIDLQLSGAVSALRYRGRRVVTA